MRASWAGFSFFWGRNVLVKIAEFLGLGLAYLFLAI
jgi:hypothetical protein